MHLVRAIGIVARACIDQLQDSPQHSYRTAVLYTWAATCRHTIENSTSAIARTTSLKPAIDPFTQVEIIAPLDTRDRSTHRISYHVKAPYLITRSAGHLPLACR